MTKIDKKETLAESLVINNGHDRASLVRQLAPDDREIVEHRVVSTGRMIDRLYDKRLVTPLQHTAATMIRDDFERSRLSMGVIAAQDPEAVHVSGGKSDSISIGDEGSWRSYRRAIQQLGEWKHVVRHVAIDDGLPDAYGQHTRSSGLAMLQIGLDRLVAHYGLTARRQDYAELSPSQRKRY